MSDDSEASGGQFSDLGGTLEAKGYQLDSAALGNVQSSVNLFRGDVNLPLTLAALPGRNGLDVKIAALYSSHVHEVAGATNADAPTGVLGLGWSLTIDAIVSDIDASASPFNRTYYIYSQGSANRLICAGRDFARNEEAVRYLPIGHEFWRILFFPAANRWEITREDGVMSVYGDPTLQAGTVQWGVKRHAWVGSSANASGEQYAVAWNLARMQHPFGDAVTFEYLDDAVPIGASSYTRAAYLSRITDAGGRTIELAYREKDASEYQPPNVDALGRNTAYQDRYETKYLDSIAIKSAAGATLFDVHCQYALLNFVDASRPQFVKRCLTGISRTAADGSARPGIQLSYASGSGVPNAGALERIVYPEGGTATYQYAAQSIGGGTVTGRIVVEPPDGRGTPRVWFGGDYTVVTWYDDDAGQLAVTPYCLAGTWFGDDASSPISAHIANDSLRVVTSADFFAVTFTDTSGHVHLQLFHKDLSRPGRWHRFDAPAQTGSLTQISPLVVGDMFVACAPYSSGSIQQLTWQPIEQTWQTQQRRVTGPFVALGAGSNYYTVFGYDQNNTGTLALYCLDARLEWQSPAMPGAISNLYLEKGQPIFSWRAAAAFSAATFITKVDDSNITYQVNVYQWDETFSSIALHAAAPYTSPSTSELPVGVSQIAGAMVGSAEHLLRFDGVTWTADRLNITVTGDGSVGFDYGSDLAVLAQKDGTVQGRRFDPSEMVWKNVDLATTTPGTTALPQISDDFLIVGSTVYHRSPSSSWDPASRSLPTDVNPTSVRNAAPLYVAYERGTGSGAQAELRLIEDGAIGDAITLSAERICVDAELPGTELASGNMLVTYPADSTFDKARRLSLYAISPYRRGTAGSVATQLDYPVVALTIHDGYEARITAYRYDASAAVYDKSGRITQYPIVRVFSGQDQTVACNPNADPPPANGYVEYQFLNGVDRGRADMYWPGDTAQHYGLLAGQMICTRTFDASARVISAAYNTPQVWKTSAGRPLPAGFARIASGMTTSEIAPLFTIASSPQIRQFLDGATESIPPDLVAAFTSARVPAFANVLSSPERIDQRWIVTDLDNRRMYFVVLNDPNLEVFSGVTEAVSTEYDDASGLPVRRTTCNRKIDGTLETIVQQMTYGYQVYPPMQAANLLVPTAQTTLNVNGSAVKSSVTSFRDWGTGQWAAETECLATGAITTYDFTKSGDQVGWAATSRILARRPCGLVVESVGMDGVHRSSVFDREDRYPVASFVNASRAEASFYGGDPYEVNPGWHIAPDQSAPPINPHDSHAGTASLELRPLASGGLQLVMPALQPTNGNRRYLLSCWYKTTKHFDADPGDVQWTIQASGGGNALAVATLSLVNTHGAWSFAMTSFDLSSLIGPGNTPVSVTILATNHKSVEVVLLDELRVSPVAGGFLARVYDAATCAVTAQLGENGSTVRNLLDGFQGSIGAIGSHDAPAVIRDTYYSRSGNGDQFSAGDPNAVVAVTATGAGLSPRFVEDTDDWQSFWQPDAVSQWSYTGGALRHQAAATGRIVIPATANYLDSSLYAVIRSEAAYTAPIGITIGGSISVRWVPGAAGRWELFDETTRQPFATDATPLETGTHRWLVVLINDAVLFYVDGRAVFGWQSPRPLQGPYSLFTGDAIAVSDVAVFEQPQLTVTYRSANGQNIQSQSLESMRTYPGQPLVNNVLANGVVLDAAGRPHVKTKPVRYAASLPRYRSTLITGIDAVTGIATGDVADYYGGAAGLSNDEGYPYLSTQYEASPLARVIACGNPGKALALANTASRHVQQFGYGANAAGDIFDDLKLYSGEFYVKTSIDQNGVTTAILRDRRGREVLRRTLDASQPKGHLTIGVDFDAAGRAIGDKPPRFFDTGDPAWIATSTYDAFDRVVSGTVPDQPHAGGVIYSGTGRCRFALSGEGAAANPPYVLYQKYDGLGRIVEVGCVPAAWDRAALQQKADDPTWPTDGNWWKRISYDGDTPSPTSIGKPSSVEVRNTSGAAADVIERMTYDARGRMVTLSTTVVADSPDPYVTSFEYDNASRLTAINYPAAGSAPRERVVYSRNSIGQIVRISAGVDGAEPLATYRYNAAGLPEREWWGDSAGAPVRAYAYNSPGWPTAIADPFFAQDIEYFSPSAKQNYYDGQISSSNYRFTWPSSPAAYGYDLRYDPAGNLIAAASTALPSGSVTAVDYDGNGNVRHFASAAGDRNYTYPASANQLLNTDGGTGIDCTYDTNGSALSMTSEIRPQPIARVTYNPYTGNPSSIATGAGPQAAAEIAFVYGGDEQRVLKTVTRGGATTTRLSLCGKLAVPLVEKTTSGATTSVTSYVHGVDGLLGFRRDGRFHYLSKDHMGSTRAVVDASGAAPLVVASYDYTPFGAPLRVTGDPSATAYQFAGLEWDSDTALHCSWTRMYDPSIQRFLGMDPLGQFGTPYGYASNNPLSFRDPSGLWSIKGFFEDITSLAVSAVEVAVGAAIDALSGGSLEAVGGALIGAGSNGLIYTATHWDSFDWSDFGVQQGVGAALGAVTGGIGSYMRVGASVTGDVADDAISVEMADLSGSRGAAARAGRDLTRQVGRCSARAQCEFDESGEAVAACFPAGTSVAGEHGPVPIEALSVGDRVWAFDERSGESALQQVTRLYRHDATEYRELLTTAGTLAVTAGHPFWVVGRGWVRAGQLCEGDRLIARSGGDLVVMANTVRPGPAPVHNIEVDHGHTYYAGDSGILVHNMCGRYNSEELEMEGPSAPSRPQGGGAEVARRGPVFNRDLSDAIEVGMNNFRGQNWHDLSNLIGNYADLDEAEWDAQAAAVRMHAQNARAGARAARAAARAVRFGLQNQIIGRSYRRMICGAVAFFIITIGGGAVGSQLKN